jgi:hypothetical protein
MEEDVVDIDIELLEVRVWGDHSSFDGQHSLDHSEQPTCSFKMAEVRFSSAADTGISVSLQSSSGTRHLHE